MKFKVSVLQHRKKWGIHSIEGANITQVENGLLELLYHTLDADPQHVRCFHAVKKDTYRRLLLYAKLAESVVTLRIELEEMK
jgi:hypothetical protein